MVDDDQLRLLLEQWLPRLFDCESREGVVGGMTKKTRPERMDRQWQTVAYSLLVRELSDSSEDYRKAKQRIRVSERYKRGGQRRREGGKKKRAPQSSKAQSSRAAFRFPPRSQRNRASALDFLSLPTNFEPPPPEALAGQSKPRGSTKMWLHIRPVDSGILHCQSCQSVHFIKPA